MKKQTIYEFMDMVVTEFISNTQDGTQTELMFKVFNYDNERFLSEFLDFDEVCCLVDCLNDWIDAQKQTAVSQTRTKLL